ncbi:alpha/beta fold hydrolase [Sphingomonas sp. Tas61C01]|uniref:alpha/beta fold hydrolase n=1 Tax=Sphingomonas sp. Tas61C01 TaxID=3458297 RepID=UPI00403EE3C8
MIGDAVLVPGTLCDGRLFGPLRARLPSMRAQVVELGRHARVEALADEALAAAPPHFIGVGFSLGGFVVLEMLRRAPARLEAVVLIAGNAHPDAPEAASLRRARVAEAQEKGMAEYVAEHWPSWSDSDDPSICKLVGDMAVATGHDAHAMQAEMNIARPDLRGVAQNSPVPLLVLAGENDRFCPHERYVTAASGPNAKLTMIRDAGHFLPLEAPQAVAEAISAWSVAA